MTSSTNTLYVINLSIEPNQIHFLSVRQDGWTITVQWIPPLIGACTEFEYIVQITESGDTYNETTSKLNMTYDIKEPNESMQINVSVSAQSLGQRGPDVSKLCDLNTDIKSKTVNLNCKFM